MQLYCITVMQRREENERALSTRGDTWARGHGAWPKATRGQGDKWARWQGGVKDAKHQVEGTRGQGDTGTWGRGKITKVNALGVWG